MRTTINFEEIIISPNFKRTPPSPSKLDKCRKLYSTGVQDREIKINPRNVLVDGYVLYCVLKEAGYSGEIEVTKVSQFYNTPTTYIFGKHPGDDKERCWYINMSYNKVKDKVGCLAGVQTKQGVQPITVTKIVRSSHPPVDGTIRKVVLI